MRWPKDPSEKGHPRMNRVYRFLRRVSRSLVSIWFREINIVDDENIPHEGGVIFISWHPSGLIDPMLMHASLPGKLSMIAKHTLFKIPILGKLIRSAGAVPIERAQDSTDQTGSKTRNKQQLDNVASVVADGGRLIIFPEGTTHTDSSVKRARSGAARILLAARRKALLEGKPEPHLVPIGLHYSESQTFRERAAVIVERVMEFQDIPELISDAEEQDLIDREWVSSVTDSIGTELKRASLSKTTWRERTLIWKGRSLAYAEKIRQTGGKLVKPTYAESVMGARRIRAGWEYLAKNKPTLTTQLVEDCENHFEELEQRNLVPLDVDARPERLTRAASARLFISWAWAAVWMLGLITWSAVIGNLVPYRGNALAIKIMKKKGAEQSIIGTLKVITAVVFFPLWWIIISGAVTWLLLVEASPVNEILQMHWLLALLTNLSPILVFSILFLWWPTSAKLHMKLYARLIIKSRQIRRWKAWKVEEYNWDELVTNQRQLAGRLVGLGEGLILPGDEDWVDPPAGKDDVVSVKKRKPTAL
ncbi:MAG TPA: 1-acyl-sn-glycerol-3-phosphate acyltransferase [Candidatus Poseidoniaceae archaeon]|nr:1-acyl-sn-glycerol-3-phosphate acyltransferase [Candidatus Poseidoniaceae archaeon]